MTFDKSIPHVYSTIEKELKMEILKRVKDKWGAFGEWISIVGPVLGMFIYVHNENRFLNQRLDSTNQRVDTHFVEINKRADILHHEFIDLLKELRKEK